MFENNEVEIMGDFAYEEIKQSLYRDTRILIFLCSKMKYNYA